MIRSGRFLEEEENGAVGKMNGEHNLANENSSERTSSAAPVPVDVLLELDPHLALGQLLAYVHVLEQLLRGRAASIVLE